MEDEQTMRWRDEDVTRWRDVGTMGRRDRGTGRWRGGEKEARWDERRKNIERYEQWNGKRRAGAADDRKDDKTSLMMKQKAEGRKNGAAEERRDKKTNQQKN